MTALAVTAIAAVTLGGFLVLRANQPKLGAVIAAAVPDSGAMAVLEQQRRKEILLDVAAHTMKQVGRPQLANRPSSGGGGVVAQPVYYPPPNPGTAQSTAYNLMSSFGFNPKTQFGCLDNIWTRESGWRYNAANASGAYGIPQALPGDRMATYGSDWQTNPVTQIKWGLWYIQTRYGDPCSAWAFWQAHGWY